MPVSVLSALGCLVTGSISKFAECVEIYLSSESYAL